jgi:hypothetical protein
VSDAFTELKLRRHRKPFEPFVIRLKDGRRFPIHRKFQFAFNEDGVLVLDERDLSTVFKTADIADFETLQAVG